MELLVFLYTPLLHYSITPLLRLHKSLIRQIRVLFLVNPEYA